MWVFALLGLYVLMAGSVIWLFGRMAHFAGHDDPCEAPDARPVRRGTPGQYSRNTTFLAG